MIDSTLTILGIIQAGVLFLTSAALVRGANGDRPFLRTLMVSSMFGIYIASLRVFADGSIVDHWSFGLVVNVWLAEKCHALYSIALHTPRPGIYLARAFYRLVFGYNPKPPTE
jgi:hypothetical protein